MYNRPIDRSIGNLSRLIGRAGARVENFHCIGSRGPEFYQMFHDAVDGVGEFAENALRGMSDQLSRMDRKLNKLQLKMLDRVHHADEGAERLAARLSKDG